MTIPFEKHFSQAYVLEFFLVKRKFARVLFADKNKPL